ncbi:MAG TPA: hypothetical protein PLG30_14210 [Bacteroidia bacterium]|nr:hypothetical protein [Bacteroidia bacterium]
MDGGTVLFSYQGWRIQALEITFPSIVVPLEKSYSKIKKQNKMKKKIIGRVNAKRKKDFPKLDVSPIQKSITEIRPTISRKLTKDEMLEIMQIISLWVAEKCGTTEFDLNDFLSHLLDYQVSYDITSRQIFKTVPASINIRESQLTVSKKWLPVGKDKIGMKPVPVVTLAGEWLEVRGFEVGELCKVMAQDGSILIQTIAKHG